MSVELVEEYALAAVGDIKETLKDKWDLYTREQKAAAQRAASRVIDLDLRRRLLEAQGASAADLNAVKEDLEFVKTTVSEFKVAGQIGLAAVFEAAFWKGVNKALEALGSFLAGAGKGLIPGL